MRILITAHIDGQLEAVGVKVAEIVETCQANQTTLSPNSFPRGQEGDRENVQERDPEDLT